MREDLAYDNEKRIDELEKQAARAAQSITGIEVALKELTTEFAEIRKTLTTGKGFLAGMLAILTPLWAIALALVSTLFNKVTSGE